MNGNTGIQPTVELATTNGNNGFAYPYPVYPMMGGFGGNSGFGGFGDNGALWLIVLLALIWGNNSNGNGGFFGGGNNFDDGYAWLSNGQKEIMNNTNNGFDTLHLSNNIQSVHDGIYSLSNQVCSSTADVISAVNGGFANAEVADNARQIANMQQAFATQTAITGAISGLSSDLASCCCDNKLAVQDLKATVISENCQDREVLREIGQNILVNQTANTQKIIDELFRDRLDEKQDKIEALNRELLLKNLEASQIAQTAQLRADNVASNEALVNLLNTCPIPSTPVYGRTAIFSCNNNGCGCNGNNNFLY